MSLERKSGYSKPKEKIKITLVNIDELAEEAAHDAAERHLTASKESMKGFKGFFKKLWSHGVAREYYRQKQLGRAREAIAENQDIYAAEQDPRIEISAHEQAMRAVVDRFASEYTETIHEGETKVKIDKEGGEKNKALHDGITGLIREYAAGTLSEENFNEARTRILSDAHESQEGAKKGKLYADNLLEVARQVKLSVEHGKSLDDLDLELDLTLGSAKNTIRTRANYNGADKLIESIKKTPVGVLVNEATLATGVAVAYAIGVGMTKRALSSKAAALLTFGGSALVAGSVTGFAENKRLKEDRRQHAREMAQGRTYEHGSSPRREEMDSFIHETREAGALVAEIRSKLYETGIDGGQETKKLTDEQQKEAIAHLADIEARIALADREAIDLIAYSKPTTVEQERLDLDLTRAQAKVDLRKILEKNPGADGKKLDELLTLATQARMEELTKKEGGIDERNALFNKMKAKKVAKAAVKGAVLGLVIGATVQEGMAFADDSKIGFAEHLARGSDVGGDGSTHVTPTEWLRGLMSNSLPLGDGISHTVALGANGHLTLPESYTLSPSDNGFQITHEGAVIADGLSVNADGSFDAESLKELTDKGFLAATTTENITHTAASQISTAEFVARHPELGHHVSRDLWFDNDTPKPVFDKNELKLWWGGKDNIGLTPDGKYEFTVDHMTAGGSYHNGLSVKAGELVTEGKMKMLFSLSDDTQTHPIEVPIGPDGRVQIDPNSETGRLLFKTVDGKPQFLGRFAEVAEVTGTDPDGTDHVRILSTYEGKGVTTVPTTITITVPETTTTLATPTDYRVEPPPIIPIFGRTPLEPVNGVRGPAPIIALPGRYYYYNAPPSDEEKKGYEARLAKSLKGNPDAILNPGLVQKAYLDSLSAEYKEKVQLLAEQAGSMSPECKLSICIPVAGHQEGENIERTLSCYLNQSADPATFEIVLFVNQPDVDATGNLLKSSI